MQVRESTNGTCLVKLTATEKRKLDTARKILRMIVKHGSDEQADKADEALKVMDAAFILLEPLPLIDKTPEAPTKKK
jgi:hypothetical protein